MSIKKTARGRPPNPTPKAKKDLTETAIDVILNEETKNYEAVVVMYDLETKQAFVKEVKPLAETQHMVLYKLKKLFVNKIMGVKDKLEGL